MDRRRTAVAADARRAPAATPDAISPSSMTLVACAATSVRRRAARTRPANSRTRRLSSHRRDTQRERVGVPDEAMRCRRRSASSPCRSPTIAIACCAAARCAVLQDAARAVDATPTRTLSSVRIALVAACAGRELLARARPMLLRQAASARRASLCDDAAPCDGAIVDPGARAPRERAGRRVQVRSCS